VKTAFLRNCGFENEILMKLWKANLNAHERSSMISFEGKSFFILYVGATLGTAPVAFQIVEIWDVDVRLLGGSLKNENGKF